LLLQKKYIMILEEERDHLAVVYFVNLDNGTLNKFKEILKLKKS
jgi:hypothetical protein